MEIWNVSRTVQAGCGVYGTEVSIAARFTTAAEAEAYAASQRDPVRSAPHYDGDDFEVWSVDREVITIQGATSALTKDEALKRLHEILDGIDRDDLEGGWWETDTGVNFGRERLRLLESLVAELTSRAP